MPSDKPKNATLNDDVLRLTGEKDLEVAWQKVYEFGKLILPYESDYSLICITAIWELDKDQKNS